MAGQLTAQRRLKTNWGIGVAAVFFGFHNLDEFQSGMERQNRVRLVNTQLEYFSAFNLVHGRFLVDYRKFPRWPLALETNSIFNYGAIDQKEAFEVAAHVGKLEERTSQLLDTGSDPIALGSVAWNSVAWNSVAWNSVAWNSVVWNSVAWNSVAWNSGDIWDD